MPNTEQMIDTHCHLDFPDFDPDRGAVLESCCQHGVFDIIVPAVSADTWRRTREICQDRHTSLGQLRLHLALGLHPLFIDQHQPQHLSELDHLIAQHRPVAIGEIGLDFHRIGKRAVNDPDKQLAFFDKQLMIAKQHALPVIIHNRKAHDPCLSLLAQTGLSGGIIHAFNGSIQQAQRYIDLGFLLGFGGMLTFTRSRKLRELARQLPLDTIVLETDAPDMTVSAHHGERNSPAYLHFVRDTLAEIKQVSPAEVARVTTNNVRRVFALHTTDTPTD
ncbi:hypothetical protein GCM10008090_11480 [Arenicella chitinivorans]|uniref:Uncharacterized protein n=1 Tax=Arenicella chitinivorans TaxID=1329800 RepID=A0A918RNL5_9GAMM|nr:TatD family hydrolase [Arenicella chitinivorans]GHA03917.1 hypothetical protein GCM10008090_11480 [Arenicella chitinivorans]